jgi:hypothetical protein
MYMTLQDIYFIAEIVGVVAVVASLVFVGKQMAQNTKALRLTAAQANTADWTATPKWIANNEDLIDAVSCAGLQPQETWSVQDATRLGSFTVISLKNLELNFLNWSDGNLSDELWFAARDGAINFFATSPFIEILWRQGLSRNFPPRFQSQVEEIFDLAAAELAEKGTLTSVHGTVEHQMR